MMLQADPIPKPEALLALERVLASRVFERAQRSQRFLRYLVEAAAAEPPIAVKEYTIAVDVFDRSTGYDPAVDATVRVEASRLRSRLREYYDEEGRDDPWAIEVPKGHYTATFQRRSALNAARTTPAAVLTPGRSPDKEEEGRAWRWWLLTAVAAFAFMLVAATAFLRERYRTSPAVAAVAAEPVSLAILPIVNRTGNPGLDAASDGLTDDLIRQLSQLPALRLIARTAVFRYSGRSNDPGTLGRALGVGTVLLSELRRTPEHLAIVAELSNAKDGSVLLDREYIVDGDDLRSVQAELQHDVIAKLHVEASALDPGRKLKSVTSSPEAYREFLKGDSLARTGSPAELHGAIAHFERAVALDPEFDLAWSAMGSDHLLLGLYFEAPRDHMPLARKFAQRALGINPVLGEAHGSLGLIHLVYDWDLPAADAELAIAGAEEASISALACTAHLMERTGKPRTAEAMLARMLTYNPESPTLKAELGCVDYYRGHYDAALRHYHEALQSDPHAALAYWGLGKTLNAEGKYPEAVAALDASRRANGFEPPLLRAETGYAYGAAGRKDAAISVVRELTANQNGTFVDPYLVAMVFASMNDRQKAFEWLNKGVAVRSPFMISLLSDPKWEPLRSDPRFTQVIQSMLNGRPA